MMHRANELDGLRKLPSLERERERERERDADRFMLLSRRAASDAGRRISALALRAAHADRLGGYVRPILPNCDDVYCARLPHCIYTNTVDRLQ